MTDHDAKPGSAPTGWIEAMDQSDADLAAGRVMPLEAVLEQLMQAADDLDVHQRMLAAPAAGKA